MYMTAKMAFSTSIRYEEVCVLLIITASIIVREKYLQTVYMTYVEAVIITAGTFVNPYFAVFYGITCYDLVSGNRYGEVLFLFAAAYTRLSINPFIDVMFIMGICTLLSHLSQQYRKKSEQLKRSFDQERRYNYELEITKNKLVNAALETAHLTEIKERNRIAQEIHDNVGHGIAGVLMLLQAAFKLRNKDSGKSEELFEKSIDSLSQSLELLKNTVYNIKPKEEYGIAHVRSVIENYSFCEVGFTLKGDSEGIAPFFFELITTNVKEALTNASKYSKATKMEIELICNEKFIRLQIRDNGVGCKSIKDSLGLSGMKDRVTMAGGSISINGDNGFMIVCVLPLNREAGVIFESINR